MPKRKRQAKKKLSGKGRSKDATRWLSNHPQVDLISAYSKRYGVNNLIAQNELMELGYYDDLCIQQYEKEGIEWEYMVDPISGEMVVVPEGTEEREIYEIHGLF